MTSLDFWPILVASVVAFVISALWYSPMLFGKEWMALVKMSDADAAAAQAKGGMWKLYLVQFVATVITLSVVAFIMDAAGARTPGDGIFLGFLLWLGFSAMLEAGETMWSKKPVKLALIETAAVLITWVVGGAIIGGWY